MNDNGFSCPCFSSEDIESVSKLYGRIIDYGEIFYVEFTKHVSPLDVEIFLATRFRRHEALTARD